MTLQEQDFMLRTEATEKLKAAIDHMDGNAPSMMLAELRIREALEAVKMVREIDGSKG